MNIIHLSDLHIGKSNNFEKSTRIFEWIINNIKSHQSDLVVITGDLVDDGATWQFNEAKDLLDRLRHNGFTVLVAPGNHDYGPEGFRESSKSRTEFAELISGVSDYPYLYISKGQAIVVLDSMEKEMENIDLWGAQGCLGKNQLQKLDLLLDALGQNPATENVVVVLHHHPFDYLFYHGMRDHEDLKGVISGRIDQPPRVNYLLFGHKHIENRFNDPEENKEELYGIDMIYASGQSVERDLKGKMVIPVINLDDKTIQRFLIK